MIEKLRALSRKLKALIDAYGPLALGVWLGIFALTWTGFYLLLSFGIDVTATAADWGLDMDPEYLAAGRVMLAYGCTQLTKPLRIVLVLGLVPAIARRRAGSKPSPKMPPSG